MKKHRWMILGMLVLLVWSGMGLGTAQAQTQVIYPLAMTGPPYHPDYNSEVTISLKTPDGVDVTGIWLPDPGPNASPVEIVVNVGTVPVQNIELVPSMGSDPIANGVRATSAYPGMAGNVEELVQGDDCSLDVNMLTCHDGGAMAVIKVTLATGDQLYFVAPQDDDWDGMATNWEVRNCPGGDCAKFGDIDTGPEFESPGRDGWANIDEYRGWMANGVHVRGNPLVKDTFMVLHDTAECTEYAPLPSPNGGPLSLADFFPDNINDLFTHMDKFGMRVHIINSTEMVNHIVEYGVLDKVILAGSTPGELEANAIEDRQVNRYAIHPLGNPHPITGVGIVKAVRLIQCLDLSVGSPIGRAGKGPPDGQQKDDGNAVLFVQRIVESIRDKLDEGAGRAVAYYTFDFAINKWVLVQTFDPPGTGQVGLDDPTFKEIMKITLQALATHEGSGGHSYDQTLTLESDRKASYGFHHAPGSGMFIDQAFEHAVDRKDTGFNRFYISSQHGTSDKRDMRILSSQ